MKIKFLWTTALLLAFFGLKAQKEVPAVFSNISYNKQNELVLDSTGEKLTINGLTAKYKLSDFEQAWKANGEGLQFSSENKNLDGTLYFGLIPYGDSKYPQPIFFKRSVTIVGGKGLLSIKKNLSGKYDMIGWEKSGKGTIGYRFTDNKGKIIFNGMVSFKLNDNNFEPDLTILEGPFISKLKPDGATIWYKTNFEDLTKIKIGKRIFEDKKVVKHHEIVITSLKPNHKYEYSVIYGDNIQTYSFKTAPESGSREAFSFAYASDSRGGNGGGERNMYGHNAYIVKKMLALAVQRNVAFMQFTGDLVSGYCTATDKMNLEYASFKQTLNPFAHYFPVVVGMGNHEALIYNISDNKKGFNVSVDKFPFETESAEALFAKNFVNPTNGPSSEDGAYYDPNPDKKDFPPYNETVYSYTYGNVAMVVLNSDYLYTPNPKDVKLVGGNIHAYILDNQLDWLKKTLKAFDKDKNIDHVFVTIHTPAFPNGGHTGDDMWYNGNNEMRPVIAGKPVKKGIIERRDEFLDIMINKSKKTVALLTGDEHNYNKLKLDATVNIYPENYKGKKIKLKRTFWQINNGSAGAPYYAREKTLWWNALSGFTTQNVVVFFNVEGKSIKMVVYNPDTLEWVDDLDLCK